MNITLSRKNSSLEVNRFSYRSNYQYHHSFQNNLRKEACLKEDIYCNHLLSVIEYAIILSEKKPQEKKLPSL